MRVGAFRGVEGKFPERAMVGASHDAGDVGGDSTGPNGGTRLRRGLRPPAPWRRRQYSEIVAPGETM